MESKDINIAKGCLIVRPDDVITVTNGGLDIPLNGRESPCSGIVLASGKGCSCFAGDRVDFMYGSLQKLDDGTGVIRESQCYGMYEKAKKSIKSMRIHDGWVLVEIPYLVVSDAEKGGLIMPKGKSSESEVDETVRRGVIKKVCKNAYNPNDPVVSSYFDKDNKVEVKVGDKVFFSSYAANSVRAGSYFYNSYIKTENAEYILIPYKELICSFEGEKFKSLNGYDVAVGTNLNESNMAVLDALHASYPTAYNLVTGDVGTHVFFNSRAQLITLENFYGHIFDSMYVYFKSDEPIGIFENATISFGHRNGI